MIDVPARAGLTPGGPSFHIGPGRAGSLFRLILTVLLGLALLAQPALANDQPAAPRIGLALGSGGASGLAHIAMLQVFDDLGIKPDVIVGSSIGAIIGGLYAAGLSAAEIRDLFDDFDGSPMDVLTGLSRSDLGLIDLLRLDMRDGGMMDPSGFLEFLSRQTPMRRFDELRLPFVAVATDYWTGETVSLSEGELFPALHASMAVPGLFKPISRDEHLLIDGGISNPLPFDLLLGKTALVIAVDVSGKRTQIPGEDTGALDLLFKSVEIMQQSIIRQMLEQQSPDLYLAVDVANVRLLHFNKLQLVLDQAGPAAEELRQWLIKSRLESADPSSRP